MEGTYSPKLNGDWFRSPTTLTSPMQAALSAPYFKECPTTAVIQPYRSTSARLNQSFSLCTQFWGHGQYFGRRRGAHKRRARGSLMGIAPVLGCATDSTCAVAITVTSMRVALWPAPFNHPLSHHVDVVVDALAPRRRDSW